MAVWHNIIVDGLEYEWQVGDDWIHIHNDGKQLCLIPKQDIKHIEWILSSLLRVVTS